MKLYLLAVLAMVFVAVGAEQEPGDPTKDVMRFKLYFAQGVLGGIATENFALISTNARKLKDLSRAAGWKLRGTREYERLTLDFQRAADSLDRAARNRNVDAATVAYFQLTTSCVTCHKYLRGVEVDVGWQRFRVTNSLALH